MPARILHVSDLHTGTREDREVERALAALIERTAPELLVASGDLTHRGRREQHERAARFLRAFERPVLAIPPDWWRHARTEFIPTTWTPFAV